MKGRVLEVMIEGKVADENAFVGRTYKDAPNVETDTRTDENFFYLRNRPQLL